MDLREELGHHIHSDRGKADRQVWMEWIVYHGSGVVWEVFCLLLFVREWKQDHQLVGGRGSGGWLSGEEKV